MAVKDNIRLFREQHNWSQEQMAEQLGMSTNGYAKIERGESSLSLTRLEQIAETLKLDTVELMKGAKTFCLISENSTHTNSFNNYDGDNQALAFEIEKLNLMLAHKDEIIASKDNEIKTLQMLVESLQGE